MDPVSIGRSTPQTLGRHCAYLRIATMEVELPGRVQVLFGDGLVVSPLMRLPPFGKPLIFQHAAMPHFSSISGLVLPRKAAIRLIYLVSTLMTR